MKYTEDNFIITGFGRSGTKFLSNLMNTSKMWNVLHEPRGNSDELAFKQNLHIPDTIIKTFNNKRYYGEVNSYLRFWFLEIPNIKRGIIFRDPKDIIKSISNRKTIEQTKNLINEVNYFWIKFNQWKKQDPSIKCIDFKLMTSDIEYLTNILQYFGITDITVTSNILNKKINQNHINTYNSFEELPATLKQEYNKYTWSYE